MKTAIKNAWMAAKLDGPVVVGHLVMLGTLLIPLLYAQFKW